MTISELFNADVHDSNSAFGYLQQAGLAATKRTAERLLAKSEYFPQCLMPALIRDEANKVPTQAVLEFDIERQRAKRALVLFAQIANQDGSAILHVNDSRGFRIWVSLGQKANAESIYVGLRKVQAHVAKAIAIFPHGELGEQLRDMEPIDKIYIGLLGHSKPLTKNKPRPRPPVSLNLQKLEEESIYIIREAVAESNKPVLLYSIGKDSSVLLHLIRKAFFPSKPPLSLLHVDTRWKFREMYAFREMIQRETGMEILVHINPEAIEKNINPFDHGASLHTRVTKTNGLKQALDERKFDMIFGGARRDEEKSRAKERIFSFRTSSHGWNPKNQRPELWELYNTRKAEGESIRVFPLSNWTELDIWQYISQENISVVPLYFSEVRPVVDRGGMLLVVDDDRMRLLPGERIELRRVRFRTLGCYPLTSAVESDATTVEDIIAELTGARTSERQGRLIDGSGDSSMEMKKAEGYF